MKKLLAQSAFWVVNKHLAKELQSNDAAIILAHLMDIHLMHPEKELVFRRVDDFVRDCNVTKFTLRKVLNMLEERGLIYREREKGTMHPVTKYKVFEDKVVDLLRSENASKEMHNYLTDADTNLKSYEKLTSIDADPVPHNNNIPNKNLGNKNVNMVNSIDIVVSNKEENNYIHNNTKPLKENTTVEKKEVDRVQLWDKIINE